MSDKLSLASEPWLFRQLSDLQRRHPDMVNPALDKILSEDAALRWALVISAYLEGHINLGKAAEFLDMPENALRKKYVSMGIPVRHGALDLEEARAEVNAIRAWFGKE